VGTKNEQGVVTAFGHNSPLLAKKGAQVTAGGGVWMIVSAINGEKKNDTVSIYTKGDGFVASYRYNW